MSEESMLRIHEVCRRVGLSRSTIYAHIKRGDFPAPVKLSLRAVGWPSSLIDDWIENKRINNIKPP